jgi:hypothetical protein
MKAFSVGLSFSICARQLFVSSTGDNALLHNNSLLSTIDVSTVRLPDGSLAESIIA